MLRLPANPGSFPSFFSFVPFGKEVNDSLLRFRVMFRPFELSTKQCCETGHTILVPISVPADHQISYWCMDTYKLNKRA
jgi:hypothetical protein